ncbi:MAG: carboxypeptidase-like regulatory domain-containing protein, partial [Acidobacteria bacterium]|nr:carboxypeptidase-like regulatory domain-containing protein [Acidobacteriota bacterium]
MRANFLLALPLVTSCSLCCFAQFETAAVLGTVRDPSGLVIPNAKITLRNVNTGITATARTDATGNFEFLTVKIGDYRVSVEAAGFAPLTTDTFNVAVNARQRVDLTMHIGPTTQTLT